MTHTDLVSVERLRQMLDYEPATGLFRWKTAPISKRYMVGKIAGRQNKTSVKLMIDRRNYHAHRLVWLYVHGVWPSKFIDHINGDPLDNRIENLREATATQNQANKRFSRVPKSGFIGVDIRPCGQRWQARIRVNGKSVHLGIFKSAEAASEAYLAAHRALHKEFSNISILGSNRANGLPSVV